MVAHRCDRIHGALHCVCIWNRDAFLSYVLTATVWEAMRHGYLMNLTPICRPRRHTISQGLDATAYGDIDSLRRLPTGTSASETSLAPAAEISATWHS